MFLSDSFYEIESRVRSKLNSNQIAKKLASGSEDSGLEHYMSLESQGQLLSHQEDIEVVWNKRFSRKLTKKIIVQLWDIIQFLENDLIRGEFLEFILENEKKYHLDTDVSVKLRLESKAFHSIYLQEILLRNPTYLDNILGNYYTLKSNKDHLTLLEILENLNFRISTRRLARPKKVQRHKGYRDHGSLPDESTSAIRKEIASDQTLKDQQNLQEEKRKELEDTLEFIKGFLM